MGNVQQIAISIFEIGLFQSDSEFYQRGAVNALPLDKTTRCRPFLVDDNRRCGCDNLTRSDEEVSNYPIFAE